MKAVTQVIASLALVTLVGCGSSTSTNAVGGPAGAEGVPSAAPPSSTPSVSTKPSPQELASFCGRLDKVARSAVGPGELRLYPESGGCAWHGDSYRTLFGVSVANAQTLFEIEMQSGAQSVEPIGGHQALQTDGGKSLIVLSGTRLFRFRSAQPGADTADLNRLQREIAERVISRD
jgi:hypothetical protein